VGGLEAYQDVNINGSSLQNQGGQIEANGTLVINMGGSTGSGSVDNQGLINASTTVITAGTVNNIGGNARIYGDKVAIGAQTLNNTPANGAAPVIAARQDMELGVQVLNNNPNVNPNSILTTNNGSLILSLGNLNIGGSLDGNNNAIGQAQQVNNLSSTLQSGGSMNINTAHLLNIDVYFAYTRVTQSSTAKDYWTLNSSVYYTQLNGTTEGQGVTGPLELGDIPNSQVTLKSCYNDSSRCNVTYGTTMVNGVQYNADNYTEYRTTKNVISDQLTVSDPAKILVGGNLSLLGNTFTTNQNSQIIVGGSLIANLSNLNNIATQGTTTTSESGSYNNYYFNRRSCCHDRTLTTGWLAYNPADIVTSSRIVGTEGFQPVQVNTSTQNGANAGSNQANTQQGLANSSGGYNGNNSSTAITTHKAADGTSTQSSSNDYANDSFAQTQSTLVQALSASLPHQNSAITAVDTLLISETPSIVQPVNDAAPTLSTALSPAQITQKINTATLSSQTNALNQPPQVKGILATLPNLALPQIALYQINSSPSATYIVETDPKFLNPASAGSLANATTLLQDLQTTSNITQKLIGDAFYQQQLVNQQIGALTGKAFISGYNTTNSEYAALLTNGATFASQYGLTLGIGLTATQMAQLTSDIVWLVSEPITLPDGTVENALVPQVYLIPRAGDVNGNGTLISANQIQLTATDDVINSGTIAGERVVVINANNISNTGDIAGTQVGLTAIKDINNIGGTVNADQKLVLSAGRDVDVTTTTQSTSNTVGASSYIQTSIDRIAGLYLGNSAHPSAKGLLSISAGHDIHLTAADISNQSIDGTTQLDAGNSVNLDTVTTAVQNNMIQNAKNYVKMGNSQDVGTQISTQGNLLVHADNQINATAATLNSANGTLQLTAKDISINNGTATDSFANANVTKKNGFLSHATITAADSLSNTHALGSSLGGKDVVISANHDLIVTGSQIIGDNSTTLAAENNLIIQNAIDTNSTSQIHDEKKSGLLSAGSSTIGFTIGKKQQTDTSTTSSSSAAASTIGSVNGNVSIIAGNQYTQTGSDIQTPNGDTNIIAKNITIQNAQDVSNNTQDQKTMQSGLTLAITNPIASAAQSIKQMADAAGHTDSNRMKTLAGASAALTAYNTKNSLKDDPMGQDGKRIGPNGTEGQTATQKAEDIRVSLTYGASQSHSHSEQDGTTASSSHITAGGDVNLIATGDKNNDQGDINIIGSDINAGHNVSLDAANTISILAAQDTNTNTSRNTSSSGAVGVAASAKDHSLGVTASASYGQGNTDGHDVTQVNSHITAGSGSTAGTASLTSGGDTIIKGGVITANTIDADVGGNLTIESLQDTSTYKSHQIDASGSVTVGYGAGASGSLDMSQVTSDYASVTEQSGLKAGDGGFNVKVKGSTDLKGGAISSTQAAIDDGKNSFSSTILTTSDIDNHASYEANSVSVSASTGGSGSAGVGHDTGSASSVTLSGISGIAGNTTARTGDAETGISKIFDATKVQSEIDAQTQITSAFGSQASKAIGDYATAQEAKATALRLQANAILTTDPVQYQSLMAQADQIDSEWGAKGTLRLGAHAIVGGLTGGISGAVGVTAGALTAPEVAKQLAAANIRGPLASTLTALASTAVGVAAGGTAGGATAFNEVNNNYLNHAQAEKVISDNNKLQQCEEQGDACTLSPKERSDLNSEVKALVKIAADPNVGVVGDQGTSENGVNQIAAAFTGQDIPNATQPSPNPADLSGPFNALNDKSNQVYGDINAQINHDFSPIVVLKDAVLNLLSFIPLEGAVAGLSATKSVVSSDMAEAAQLSTQSSSANSTAANKLQTIITPQVETKILYGERVSNASGDPTNRVVGAHSGDISNDLPNYAVENLSVNADGTRNVKLITQFDDGNVSKIKSSTLFPNTWTNQQIIDAVKIVGNTLPVVIRADGSALYQSTVNGVNIEVIKVGDQVTAGYPAGRQGFQDPQKFATSGK
jgi:filamentous hemagglutinin